MAAGPERAVRGRGPCSDVHGCVCSGRLRTIAGASLAQVCDDARASLTAAALCAAYTRYWRRDDGAAVVAAFDAAVAAADASLIDDAATVPRAPASGPATSTAQAHPPRPRAWHTNGRPAPASTRTGGARATGAPARGLRASTGAGRVRPPAQQVVVMLDGDGSGLAAAHSAIWARQLPSRASSQRPQATKAASPLRAARARRAGRPHGDTRGPIVPELRRRLRVASAPAARERSPRRWLLVAHTWGWDRRIPRGGRDGSA
jgi:hypothetical protein